MTPEKTHKLPLHGVLLELHSIGVYLIGDSGIGKSETALQLLHQGARLICDDAPELNAEATSKRLIGRCPEGFYGLMHLRDLGIINIMQLIGPDAFKAEQEIHFIIELTACDDSASIIPRDNPQQLLTPDYQHWQYSDWQIPGLRLHVSGSRNTALLIATAVKQFQAYAMVSAS